MGAVENVLVGAVDRHCHSGPSPMPRRITHVEAAQQAAELGFLGQVGNPLPVEGYRAVARLIGLDS